MTLVVDDITKQACSLEAISENKGEKPACTFEASVYLKGASLTTVVMVDIGLIAAGFQKSRPNWVTPWSIQVSNLELELLL
ncbi:hypothetical protein H920_10414 [Fukomys damarensis]|uniref:Uncharacterized protein n=1 Tax=Fukomys damarensis TaxID=885580 RepID=A0A091DD87_FUKDA|nr:hypothetical protein H920_10414 [Fukomys damarensis]